MAHPNWCCSRPKYEATRFFSTYPTGFMVFNAATKGGSSLTVAQRLAALGPDLRGRRVIFAIGPAIMTMAPFGDVAERHYEGNFSELHALELAFNPHLSLETKSLAAQRMLEFPGDPRNPIPLFFTMRRLADPSPWSTAVHYLSWPLGAARVGHPPAAGSLRHRGIHSPSLGRGGCSRSRAAPDRLAGISSRWPRLSRSRTPTAIPMASTTANGPRSRSSLWRPPPRSSRDEDFINDVTHCPRVG